MRGSSGRSDDDSEPRARVCVLVADQGNQQVLTDWLAAHDRYILAEEPADTAAFALCVVDARSLAREEATLRRRKDAADELLPVLLLVPEAAGDGLLRELRATRPELWGLVDGVVRFPLSEADLASQIDTLLRLREQSRQLARQEQQFKILNRVLRHDIRNDMNVVLGWLDVLADHVDDAGRPQLERVESAAEHVVELTAVARDLAATVGDADPGPGLEPMSLTRVLVEEVEKCREAFENATIELPASPPDLTVEANELLSSVFRNLLNNAVQHNDGDPVVSMDLAEREGRAIVRIADNGPGVPDELKREVFDDEVKGLDSVGTGMGLYLVSTLVDTYGGEAWVEDNDPRGSVFCVALDVLDPASADAAEPAVDGAGSSDEGSG
jgi:signal transduction histidine kinase